MKRWVAWCLLAMFSVASLGACNTVKGVGKDLEKVGGKMQRKADETGGTSPD